MADKKRKPPVRRATPADKIRLPERGKAGNRADPKAAEPPPAEENYYRLKTQAVEDLVTANEENSPPVPLSELRKYHAAPKITVADWVKALLLKAWAAGMVCYFFIWGLSTYAINQLDHLLVLAIALGMVTNLIVSNIFRFIAKTPGAYDRWMMFPKKGIVWLPADLVYAAVLILCVLATYNAVNAAAARFSGNPDAVALGVEPLLFGVFTLLWDLLFLGVKRLLFRIVSDAKSGGRPPADPFPARGRRHACPVSERRNPALVFSGNLRSDRPVCAAPDAGFHAGANRLESGEDPPGHPDQLELY